MQIPFVGGAYESSALSFDAQRCVNLQYVSGESGNSKSQAMLIRTPGLLLKAALDGTNGIRAVYPPTDGGPLIVVQGSSVYRVDSDFNYTHVADIDLLTAPIIIKDDGGVAVLTTGPNGYTLPLGSNTLAGLSGFSGSRHVCFMNNYFIFAEQGTNRFYISGLGTTSIDALDFASAESNAEPIITPFVNHNELILFKKTVTEVWRTVDNPDFPFQRDTNASIEQGCEASYSVVDLDNTVFWLGRDKNGAGIVWRLNGYTPQRVSNEGIETAIQSYGDVSDAVAYGYQQNGHDYYVISFPTGNATWVYDVKERKWHEKAYKSPATGLFNRHRAATHAYFNGQHIVGDWENGNLYQLDLNTYSDNGDPLIALRTCAHISEQDYNNIRYDRFTLDIEAGVGLQSGQGSDPQIMIRTSKNGGKTYLDYRTMSIGKVGDYTHRAYVTRLGSARSMTFEVSVSEPVKVVFMGAAVLTQPLSQ